MAPSELSEGSKNFLITPEKLAEVLPLICSRETTADPNGWSADNPLWGHCAVVSVLVQQLYGGKLLRASLMGTVYEEGRSHYINLLSGKEIDFTAAQFVDGYPEGLTFEERDRQYILSFPETAKRYELLCEQLKNYLELD